MAEQRSSEAETGRPNRRARKVVIVGGTIILLAALAYVALLPTRGRYRDGGPSKTDCKYNLRSIAQAVQTWSLQRGGSGAFYPPSLRAVYDAGIIETPDTFVCPFTDTEAVPGRFVSDYDSIFDLIGEKLPTSQVSDSLTPLAWDKPDNHENGMCVVYFDGHVVWLSPWGPGPEPMDKIYRDIVRGLGPELRTKVRWGDHADKLCEQNLNAVAEGAQQWASKFGGGKFYPSALRALYDNGSVDDWTHFICPRSDTRWEHALDGPFVSSYDSILDRVDGRIPEDYIRKHTTPLAWTKSAKWHNGVYVVHIERYRAEVEFIEGEDALEKVHRKVEKWLNEYEKASESH
ncbi:MAG: hypothetical protein R6V58_12140 [Planctomycetota bacterium]